MLDLFIRTHYNSFGKGYGITGYKDGVCFSVLDYYGYTKRQAIKEFRKANNLVYKHINIYEW